ncbi:MAG: 1-acyl-sn-glycerol-3-phosphate acyltransferase [Candidatus Zixiibacteriota bacterium]|nr:MAG: 1-acyl-sn-glycerol-3-phosphate acyltransferase [candidate division Zixibacteria bacterium]
MKILYYSGWLLTRIISKLFFRIKVSGRHHFPPEGGFILATNHRSYLDPLLAGSWARRQVYFLAKKELFANRFFGWMITQTNALPVKRGTIDRHALKMCLDVISEGYGLTIFPEGTRAKRREFLDPRPGIGVIALEARVPIVPAYINGSNRLKDCLLGRDRLGIYYGEPLPVDALDTIEAGKAGYMQIAELVMNRIKNIREGVK